MAKYGLAAEHILIKRSVGSYDEMASNDDPLLTWQADFFSAGTSM
jgi:hypothetical protein